MDTLAYDKAFLSDLSFTMPLMVAYLPSSSGSSIAFAGARVQNVCDTIVYVLGWVAVAFGE